MNLNVPWSKDTPWGVSKDAEAALQAFFRLLKEKGELPADILDLAPIAECIDRGLIECRRDPKGASVPSPHPDLPPILQDWLVSVTPRGKAVWSGINAIAKGKPDALRSAIERFRATFPKDDRSVDEIMGALFELQKQQKALEPEVTQTARDLWPMLAAGVRAVEGV